MNNRKIVKTGLIQHAYKGSVEATIGYVEVEIRNLANQGAKIICLQELFCYPYFCRVVDPDFFQMATAVPGILTDFFFRLVKELNIVLIVPFFEKRAEGIYHNSVIVYNPDGNISGVYRKNHIPEDPCFYEKYYFTPGDAGYKVFHTPFASIGVLICWDQWFPEAARILALMGAEIIFYPTAIGIIDGEENKESTFKNAWQMIQRSHAIANGVYVVSVNRVGREGELSFWGGSFISDPFGEILGGDRGKEEGAFVIDIDLKSIEETRITWPFLRDRRIDTYDTLLRRFVDNAG